MPSSDPRDRLFYPTLTLMIDSYVKYNNHFSKLSEMTRLEMSQIHKPDQT